MKRTALALETMQLYAPMAHALDAGPLCAELEDLSLKELFPSSYRSLEQWLRGEGPADRIALDRAREWLFDALVADPGLMTLVGGPRGVQVKARRKSLFSTMRKVLRDGRPREEVHDLLGMRVIVTPQIGSPSFAAAGGGAIERAAAERSALAACYRAQQIAHGVFDVVPGRTKDYLQRPKPNGYRSLHSTLKLPTDWTDNGVGGVGGVGGGAEEGAEEEEDAKKARDDDAFSPRSKASASASASASALASASASASASAREGRRVELQIRTAAMHAAAEMGTAAHTAYKGGFKEDPGAADALAELVAAANTAATQRFGSFTEKGLASDGKNADPDADRMFRMFDLDGDGVVTRDEIKRVINDVWLADAEAVDADSTTASGGAQSESLGAADELIEMLDANNDGSVSAEEFTRFRASVKMFGSLPRADAATAAAIEGSFSSVDDDSLDAEDEDEDADVSAADVAEIVIDAELVVADADASASAFEIAAAAPDTSTPATTTIATAAAAEAEAEAMSPPPLPPPPPAGRVRAADETLRDASKAIKDKSGGVVEWQLVWDLMRAGRPETARELFYQRTSKTPSITSLWEQWARFELLQGDAERARGLYRAALLHAEGRPRARAESLRKWAVMEFGAGERVNAAGLFERAMNVLEEAERAARVAEEGEEDSGAEEEREASSLSSSSSSSGVKYDASEPGGIIAALDDPGATESSASLRAAQAVVLHAWSQTKARSGEALEARALLSDAEAKDPSNPRVIHALAQLDEAAGDVLRARERYELAAANFPGDAHIALSRARLERVAFGDVAAARDIFSAAAEENPKNYRVLQAWAVMESESETSTTGAGGGLATARHLFRRATEIAPWSSQTWSAWANAEWRRGEDAESARALYAEGLDVEPTNVVLLRGLGKLERETGRIAQARDYLTRAVDLEPKNALCVKELAKLEDAAGNAARAARYFNVAKELKRDEMKALAATKTAEVRGKTLSQRGRKGTWDPGEAAAAARGAAAVSALKGASYSASYRVAGGDAGGGAHNFRSVLAAARGDAAVARRDRGVEGGGGGGGVYRRRRANTTWRRSDRNVPRPEGSVDADEGESSSSFEEDLRNFRGERVYKARGGIGSSLDGRGRGGIGSSLDAGRGARGGRSSSNSNSNSRGGIGSSLDGSVDASGSVDGSMDDLYRSYVLGDAAADRWDDDDERGDSLDDELRQSWLKDSGYYSVDETIDDR